MTATAPTMSTPWPVDREIPDIGWRPPSGTVVVSADDHLIEPDVWIDRPPPIATARPA